MAQAALVYIELCCVPVQCCQLPDAGTYIIKQLVRVWWHAVAYVLQAFYDIEGDMCRSCLLNMWRNRMHDAQVVGASGGSTRMKAGWKSISPYQWSSLCYHGGAAEQQAWKRS